MTPWPPDDVLRSSAVQNMNFHLEHAANLTDDSNANEVIRGTLRSAVIDVPSIREIDSEDRVDVIANLASVIMQLYGSLKGIRDQFPELQQAPEQ